MATNTEYLKMLLTAAGGDASSLPDNLESTHYKALIEAVANGTGGGGSGGGGSAEPDMIIESTVSNLTTATIDDMTITKGAITDIYDKLNNGKPVSVCWKNTYVYSGLVTIDYMNANKIQGRKSNNFADVSLSFPLDTGTGSYYNMLMGIAESGFEFVSLITIKS